MKSFLLVSFYFFIGLTPSARATDISMKLVEHKLVANIENISYPQELIQQELKSGLPNTINLSIKISNNDQLIKQKIQSLIIVYDLWDEIYNLSSNYRLPL